MNFETLENLKARIKRNPIKTVIGIVVLIVLAIVGAVGQGYLGKIGENLAKTNDESYPQREYLEKKFPLVYSWHDEYFKFPFQVKEAGIEMVASETGMSFISVSEVKGDVVVVEEKPKSPKPENDYLLEGKVAYRVWAISK